MRPQELDRSSPDRHAAKTPRERLRSLPFIAIAVAVGGLAVGLVGRSQPSSAEFTTARAERVTEAAYTTPTFSTTPEQWEAFSLAEVATRSFEATKRTDGQIAIDDDLSTPVFSPYTGRVTRVIARPGDVVKAGQPLFAVQANEFVQAQNDLFAAVATLRTTRAQFRMAQTNEARTRGLYGAQAGSLKDWQQSQLDLATAQGNVDAASVALGAIRSRLHILGKTEAEIASLEEHPGNTQTSPEVEVRAPIAGTIIQRQIGIGQYIVSAFSGASNGPSSPVYTIGDLSKVWLVANVREVDAGSIRVGDHVSVHVPAFPGRAFTARVSYVAPAIDPTTRRLSVRAEIDNHDLALKPQMFGSFSIVTGAATVSAAVPERGVVYEDTEAYVWVAHPDEKTLEMRRVHTDHVANGMAEITEGLKPGERVVTSGAVFIDRPTETD